MLELITKPQHLLVEKRGRLPEVEWCSFFEVQTLAELEAALCLSEKRSYDLNFGILWSYVVLRWWVFQIVSKYFFGIFSLKNWGKILQKPGVETLISL